MDAAEASKPKESNPFETDFEKLSNELSKDLDDFSGVQFADISSKASEKPDKPFFTQTAEVDTVSTPVNSLDKVYELLNGTNSECASANESDNKQDFSEPMPKAIPFQTPERNYIILNQASMGLFKKAPVGSYSESLEKRRKKGKSFSLSEEQIQSQLAQLESTETRLLTDLSTRVNESDLLFAEHAAPNVVSHLIEKLRPSGPISRSEYDDLFREILNSYTVAHLRTYLKICGIKCSANSRKKALIEEVLKHWNVTLNNSTGSASSTELRHKLFNFSPLAILTLLGNDGLILFGYIRNGLRFMSSPTKPNEVMLQGTELKLKWFEADFTKRMSSLWLCRLNTGPLKNTFMNSGLTDAVLRAASVHFEPTKGGFIISALYKSLISRTLKYITRFLDFNNRATNQFWNFEDVKGKFYTVLDDFSFPSLFKGSKFYRLRLIKRNVKVEAESLPNQDLDLRLDSLYDELFKKGDKGILSANLGQILFRQKDITSDDLKQDMCKAYYFHPKVVDAQSKISGFEQYEPKTDASEDPNVYYGLFRFVPSPFVKVGEEDALSKKSGGLTMDLTDYNTLPELEAWVELNSSDGGIIWETLSIHSIEKERNIYLNLPDLVSDLKLSLTQSSTFLDLAGKDTPTLGLDEVFKHQPGMLSFFRETSMRDKRMFSSPRSMEVKMNGKDVSYVLVSDVLRRQNNLKSPSGLLVQLTRVDGNYAEGRRDEISILCNTAENETPSKEKFKGFIKEAVEMCK